LLSYTISRFLARILHKIRFIRKLSCSNSLRSSFSLPPFPCRRFPDAASLLPLPCRRFPAAVSLLPFPCCRFPAAVSLLPLPPLPRFPEKFSSQQLFSAETPSITPP